MSASSFSSLVNRAAAVLLMGAAVAWAPAAFAQSSASPYTYATRYDLLGRVTGTIAPDPDGAGPLAYQAVRNTYDDAGRLTKVESGELSSWQSEGTAPSLWPGFAVYKTIETSYNAQNQKIREIVKGSDGVATAATHYKYDNFGRLQCTAIRMDPSQWSSQTDACVPQTTGPFGPDRITKNIYNARGDLVTIQKAVGTSLAEDYATYTYSPNGNRTSVTDARGYKATMEFDGLDRQVRWNFPCPTELNRASPCATPPPCPPNCVPTSDYEQYGYDANSNRTSLRKRDGSTITYDFDALDRMWRKVVPERSGLNSTHTRDVYYGYDSFGRQTYARFDSSSGEGITTSYNGFSEVTASSNSMMAGTGSGINYQFDANGNRTRITYWDGSYLVYEFDGLDRAKGILRSGSATIVNYTYNARGMRATMGGNFVTSYLYHPDGRLSTLSNTPLASNYAAQYTFSYNPASQIVQQTRSNDAFAWTGAINQAQSYSANGLNQYTMAGFAHDANGNLTSDGATSYLYDVENRLVSASGAKDATLRYDPMGRLFESSTTSNVTRFIYDGDALVMEWNGAGAIQARYVHGPDAGDDPIARFVGGGWSDSVQLLYRIDHQGSIVAVTDATSANVLGINSYDEYGVPGNLNIERFQYTGQAWMSELGLYYYKARMYSPILGRFLQTDPIGYKDNLNLYAYVSNDPPNGTDPTGLCDSSFTPLICGMSGGGSRAQSTGQQLAQSPVGGLWSELTSRVENTSNSISDSRKTAEQSGFKVKGLLAGEPSVAASGIAAAGAGMQATKGIYNSDSSIGVVTPAMGLAASADVNLINLSYTGSNAKPAPVEMRAGVNIEGHFIVGGRVSMGYTPPSNFDISVDVGFGLGAAAHLFEVNAVIEED